MGVKLLYAGLETCFRWDPRHLRCWAPIEKCISNPDVAPFWFIICDGWALDVHLHADAALAQL